MLFSCSSADSETDQYIAHNTYDYLGQEPPDSIPVVFNASKLVNGMACRDIAISPGGDEIFFRATAGNRLLTTIIMVKRNEEGWMQPEIAPFATDSRYDYMEPAFTPNGNKLFFSSNQPLGDTSTTDFNIWYIEKKNGDWTSPKALGPEINTAIGEYFPSLTRDETLYFTRTDSKARTDYIYRSRMKNGTYDTAEKLPEPVNEGSAQFNAFIAPDESYIIIPVYGREDSYGGCDYYISYRDVNDNWTALKHLPAPINTKNAMEWSPFVSPDGEYFFFMSGRKINRSQMQKPLIFKNFLEMENSSKNGNPSIYWVKADFIEKLKQ